MATFPHNAADVTRVFVDGGNLRVVVSTYSTIGQLSDLIQKIELIVELYKAAIDNHFESVVQAAVAGKSQIVVDVTVPKDAQLPVYRQLINLLNPEYLHVGSARALVYFNSDSVHTHTKIDMHAEVEFADGAESFAKSVDNVTDVEMSPDRVQMTLVLQESDSASARQTTSAVVQAIKMQLRGPLVFNDVVR